MQLTEANVLLYPTAFGLGTTDQAIPPQVSTRVPPSQSPTAVHDETEVQSTPFR